MFKFRWSNPPTFLTHAVLVVLIFSFEGNLADIAFDETSMMQNVEGDHQKRGHLHQAPQGHAARGDPEAMEKHELH